MFWEKFVMLCNQRGLTPSAVCAELGFSSAIATKWKSGAAPRSTSVYRIAQYFGVQPDFLLSKARISFASAETATECEPKNYTNKEKAIIKAYRAQPELQPAVDRLLNISADDPKLQDLGTVCDDDIIIYSAAKSTDDRQDGYVRISIAEWERILGTKETDDKLI